MIFDLKNSIHKKAVHSKVNLLIKLTTLSSGSLMPAADEDDAGMTTRRLLLLLLRGGEAPADRLGEWARPAGWCCGDTEGG
jgi:hypothetical protein